MEKDEKKALARYFAEYTRDETHKIKSFPL